MGRHDERRDISREAVGRAKVAGQDVPPRDKDVKPYRLPKHEAKDLTEILGEDRPRGWTGRHRGRG
jgi:hypothetical protein